MVAGPRTPPRTCIQYKLTSKLTDWAAKGVGISQKKHRHLLPWLWGNSRLSIAHEGLRLGRVQFTILEKRVWLRSIERLVVYTSVGLFQARGAHVRRAW